MQFYLPIAEISVNLFIVLGLGTTVGILSGIFGVGGGFILTPLLFFIGIPPGIAVGTQGTLIVASSFSAFLNHLKKRTVDFPMGGLLLVGGLVGSTIGVRIFHVLTALGQVDLLISLCYVVLLGIVGGLMFREALSVLPHGVYRFTDYLDDVSGNYVDFQTLLAGNGELAAALGNRTGEYLGTEPVLGETGQRGDDKVADWYFLAGLSLSWNFLDNGLVGSRGRSTKRSGCKTY